MKKFLLFIFAFFAASGIGVNAEDEVIIAEDVIDYAACQANKLGSYESRIPGTQGAEYYSNDFDYTSSQAVGIFAENSVIQVTKPTPDAYVLRVMREGALGAAFEVYKSHRVINKYDWLDYPDEVLLAGTLGVDETLEIEGNYEYIALRCVDSSFRGYFNKLVIVWGTRSGSGGGGGGGDEGDHIDIAGLVAQNPDGKYDANGYNIADSNAELSYTGASGAQYTLTNVCGNAEQGWWSLVQDDTWSDPVVEGGKLFNTTSAGYLKTVKFKSQLFPPDYYQIFVANEPITKENRWDVGESVYLEKGSSYTWNANSAYKYIYVAAQGEYIKDLEIVWQEEAPVEVCMPPYFNLWEDPVPGVAVQIGTDTKNADFDIKVYVNGELDDEASKVTTDGGSYASVPLPGVAGDVVKLVARTIKDGCEDSAESEIEYTLVMPKASMPESEYLSYVVPGSKFSLSSATENATITYRLELIDYSDSGNGWTGEDVTVASPAEITVPADAVAGTTFHIQAWANAEGYRRSDRYERYIDVVSPKLDAPVFSIASGEVRAGTVVTITRCDRASSLGYTVNGGEIETADYSAQVVIDKDTEIVAWSIGVEPFINSDNVTAVYTLEVIGSNTDELVPAFFGAEEANYDVQELQETSAKTGVVYNYRGSFANSYDGELCFYMQDADHSCILYNSTTDGHPVSRVKIDGGNSWCSMYLLFSKDAPVTEVTQEMLDPDGYEGRLLVGRGSEYMPAFKGFGTWIDLSDPETAEALGMTAEELAEMKYVSIYSFGQNNSVSRVLVEYVEETIVLDAPEFSIESGSKVNKGTTLVIHKAADASAIAYIINEGEVQTSENDVEIVLNEDISIEAWSVGVKPYADSAHVMASYEVEEVGVSSVEAEEGEMEIYTLDGLRVEGDRLAPGVYIAVRNGVASRILVK